MSFLRLFPCYVLFVLFFPAFAHLANGEGGNEFINQAVTTPFVDGINLGIPEEFAGNRLAESGLVDVTAPPFLADPLGLKDSTAAIKKAVIFARDHQMVCFFPSGKYLVSDTVECIQNLYRRSNGVLVNGRDFPCVLMGSRMGKRPEIILKSNSHGFQNPENRKYVLHFWARGVKDASIAQPSISMNQMLINLDITIGADNPGAVAIRHQGAQGSGIQESTINATHGLVGIEGGCGSGGSHAGVTVIGGRIGLDMRESQPAPTIAGITLIDQSQTAILYEGRQTLTAVGIKITSRTHGPVIKSGDGGKGPFRGQISLIDSEVAYDTIGQRTAIAAGSSLYLKNVYVKNASHIVTHTDRTVLRGNDSGWLLVREYAHGIAPRPWKGVQYSTPVIRGGVRQTSVVDIEKDSPPPTNLQGQHQLAPESADWENGNVINAKAAPYLAKGDGKTDDYAALQRAIDEHDAIFLPKGYYLISRPLKLRPGTRLMGVASHLAIITPNYKAPAFSDAAKPAPLLQSAGDRKANTVLAFLTLYAPKQAKGAYALEWRSGGTSVVRNVNFTALPPLGGFGGGSPVITKNFPLVRITAAGGGSWWNFFQEEHLGQGEDYRHVLISDASGPVRFYQCNPEHATSGANFEIRNSKDVSVYGLKGEGNKAVMRILHSENIAVYGYGGNAAALEGKALFEIIDSGNISLVNLVDSPRLAKEGSRDHYAGVGVDPSKWHMAIEKKNAAGSSYAAPLERPVLYQILSNVP